MPGSQRQRPVRPAPGDRRRRQAHHEGKLLAQGVVDYRATKTGKLSAGVLLF